MSGFRKSMRLEPVTESSAWLPRELKNDVKWIHSLTGVEQQELAEATSDAIRRGLIAEEFEKRDFPLPTVGSVINRLVDEVENGRGIGLIRGVAVNSYDDAQLRILYWGIGVHAGHIISQNSKGQLLAEVTDRGNSYNDPNARGFATNAELVPHVDTSDMTVLLCIRTAKTGGESRLVSSTSVYNSILAEHPEYLEALYQGFYNDLRGEGPTGDINELTHQRIPVYSYHAGRVSCSFNSRMIENALQKRGETLDPQTQQAYDFMCSVSRREELTYRFMMEPGDIQMISNHSVFHSRTQYEDHIDPARKRNLYRLWVNVREGRELADDFSDRYNTGPRGGVAVGQGARYSF